MVPGVSGRTRPGLRRKRGAGSTCNCSDRGRDKELIQLESERNPEDGKRVGRELVKLTDQRRS